MRAPTVGPAVALLALALAAPLGAQEAHPGKAVYDRWCSGCHGDEGRGDGPAARRMLPRPRDFTKALYQIRSTASGMLPTDADLLHVIDVGMPGTAMPPWEGKLSRQERDALVGYLKTFSRFFETEAEAAPLEFGREPSPSEEGLAEGRAFYESIECWRCHGQEGRGDGVSAAELQDDEGNPIAAADLTEPWTFNGGATTAEIFARLRTGLDGTPMPSFSDLLESGFMNEDQLWRLAQYVRSLGPEEAPRVREVVRARRAAGPLPTSPSDPAWAGVERFFVPMVAQIVVRPRWFAPRVDGVWVQALHDGQAVALRLAWSDPSRSPDPAWQLWQERVIAAMEPREGGLEGPQPLPDAFAVQFPRAIPEGREHPYFLMGDAREPVHLWSWRSTDAAAQEAEARGMAQVAPLPSGGLASAAEFEHGQWRLFLRRSLETADSTGHIQLRAGEPIPVAFFAWDGSNGEAGTQGSVSSWYYLYLDPPASTNVFVVPIAATLFTLAIGFVVVVRAQRREARGEEPAPDPS